MKSLHGISIFLIAFASLTQTSEVRAGVPEPTYWPTCSSPQNIAPIQWAGGIATSARPAVAWNGQEYGVAWVDAVDGCLHFRRFFADGTPGGATVVPSSALNSSDTAYPPGLVWDGAGWAVAWDTRLAAETYRQAYFLRLYADGSPNGSPLRVSFSGSTPTAAIAAPQLATNGSGYAVVWQDTRSGNNIYASLLNGTGAVTYPDLPICNASNDQGSPTIVWSTGVQRYVTAWQDYRTGTQWEIRIASIPLNGLYSPDFQIISGPSSSYSPALADAGTGLGLAWHDLRDTNYEIYFALLTANGFTKIGTDVRLTNASYDSVYPRIVWTGAEYGVIWNDYRQTHFEVWFQRVSSGGVAQGTNVQATATSSMLYPGAAFGAYGYLLTGANTTGANYVIPWGCASDATPPTCPGNLLAYNVTGASATVSWSPAGEDYSDIAYYEVYRNNAVIARTAAPYFGDSGLSLGTTYNYMVQPVNAAQLQNRTCTSSLYLKTNATLTLMVNKNAPDARLTWTDASMNNYNVFRGTSPQVMTQIGDTSGQQFDDPNVLLDGVIYYYTVDEPGW